MHRFSAGRERRRVVRTKKKEKKKKKGESRVTVAKDKHGFLDSRRYQIGSSSLSSLCLPRYRGNSRPVPLLGSLKSIEPSCSIRVRRIKDLLAGFLEISSNSFLSLSLSSF